LGIFPGAAGGGMSPSVVSGPPAGAQAGYQSFGVTQLDIIECVCEMYVWCTLMKVERVDVRFVLSKVLMSVLKFKKCDPLSAVKQLTHPLIDACFQTVEALGENCHFVFATCAAADHCSQSQT